MPGQKSFIENRRSGFYTDKYGSYIGKNAWVRENLNADIQFLKNSWKYTSVKITPYTGYKATAPIAPDLLSCIKYFQLVIFCFWHFIAGN